jgi:GNAT superfamily N-acetyltransferase
VSIVPVHSDRDLRRFIDFPYQLHARDPLWVPPLRRDVKVLLSRTKNPFFEHAEAEYFLAERSGQVVGRIAAIANRLHNQTHADKVGFFGFFEAVDDQTVADALLNAAAAWLAPRGFDTMRGPASFSTNDESGLLVEGFDTPPVLMMPHNPPYYLALLERAGFATAKNLLVYQHGRQLGQVIPVPERLTRATQLITERLGITIRPLRMDDFKAEVDRVKALYNKAWEHNWGFIPMTDHEIDHLAAQFKPVVVPSLGPFVEKDGKVIAFALALPDLNSILATNRSGRMFPVILKLLWRLKTNRIYRLRITLLGVLPEYRGKGIDAVLYHWIWTRGGMLNYSWGEAGWILEDNPAMNAGLVKMGFTVYKTYRLLDRPI